MEPGVDIVDLPEIDFILLSHNHYDHMDISALKMISKRDKPIIYTTLGNNKYLKKKGIIKGVDMDWGESKKFSDLITVECVPAQHFSARAFSDRNKTLWGGFVIKGAHGDIYFAGDTGYGPFIEHIKKIYPDGFRLAFLPIGAFKPKSFMGEIHLSPDDAIDIYKDLKIKHAIPVHFGTFDLALDKQDEPIEHLKKHLSEAKNSDVDFKILLNGQHVSLK
jgi:L-ascorbate metabolism protein UlaG (beta-lactamase superfamily)